MGIRGLTTYILKNSDIFLQNIELHDTYLVIDGLCIALGLYENNFQCAFGGQYDMHSKLVEQFFDDLLECNITPIVLLHSEYEDKKLGTITMRYHEKMELAINPSRLIRPSLCQNNWHPTLLPPFLKQVLEDVLIEKKIKYIETIFEAGSVIATVAKMLNCPILGNNSNFFICGIPYIPLSKLENGTFPASQGDGLVKNCYLYQPEKFVQTFNGSNKGILPLAAVLLGNDYVDSDCFYKSHLQKMEPFRSPKHVYCKRYVCIEKTLRWLCERTMDTAITDILSMVPKEQQNEISNAIEATMRDYTYKPTDILLKLGFDQEFVRNANKSLNKVSYQWERKENLNYSQPTRDSLGKELEGIDADVIAAIKEAQLGSNASIVRDLPDWFLEGLSKGDIASYFLDILVRRLVHLPIKLQNPELRPPHLIASNILRIIYSLLVWGYKRDREYLNCIGKGEKFGLRLTKLELIDLESKFKCNIPNLHGLRELPLTIRSRIINDTLLIRDEQIIKELPEKWQLYIAAITYWAQEREESIASKYHIHCLLFTLLFDIIDKAIGYYRSMELCKKKYQQLVNTVKQSRQMKPPQANDYPVTISIKEAYSRVDREDCLLMAPFFINHFQVNPGILSEPEKLDRTVLHAFSQLKCCLKETLNLNSLLGNVYTKTRMSETFNGVLLYNLYIDFSCRRDIEDYINYVLSNAPSLLRLYKVLLNTVNPLFSTVLANS